MQRNEARKKIWKICNIPCRELDAILCRFFAEIRKKDSQGYEPESLAVLQCSLDRHLKTVAVFCEIVNLQIQGNNLKRKQENYERRVTERYCFFFHYIIVILCDYGILFCQIFWK